MVLFFHSLGVGAGANGFLYVVEGALIIASLTGLTQVVRASFMAPCGCECIPAPEKTYDGCCPCIPWYFAVQSVLCFPDGLLSLLLMTLHTYDNAGTRELIIPPDEALPETLPVEVQIIATMFAHATPLTVVRFICHFLTLCFM